MNQLNSIAGYMEKAIQHCHDKNFQLAKNLLDELERRHELDDDACFLMGSVLGQLGQYADALVYYQRAIDLAPDKPQAYVGQVKSLLVLGRAREAEECYERLIERKPASGKVILQLANMLLQHGRYEAAETRFHQVLELDKDAANALSGLGQVYQALRKPELAKVYYERAVGVEPDNSSIYCMLGRLLLNQGQFKEAEECLNTALQLDGTNVEARRDLGHLHLSMNRPSAARDQLARAMELQPKNLDVIAALARLEDQSGNLQVAYDLLNPFIERNIYYPEIGVVYAAICRHFNRCQEAIDYLEHIIADHDDKSLVGEKLHFALGRLYDRMGKYDDAFYHFRLGNQLKPDTYNKVEDVARIDDLIKTCDWNYFVSASRSTQTTDRPVFIVGMPRSGTTLTEQILASHPDVCGLGELAVMPGMIRDLDSYLGDGAVYPGSLRNLTTSILDSMARDYLEEIGSLGPIDTLRVIDKSLVNYLYLGLISQMFPKSRIIHCVRDPRDTCLSIYFQNFDASHYYASRLENIAVHYSQYRRVMRHWQSLLDIPILEIQYEDLVIDQEKKSRELIEFAGLKWDDRVIGFHETKRSVVTASYDQVRQKIYTGSIDRWRNYEKYIGSLVGAFDFALEQDA